MFTDLFEQVPFPFIFSAALFFMAGLYFAPSIVDRDIRWMLIYPRWVAKLMEKYFSGQWSFFIIFILILTLNNFSLFGSLLSGFLVFLPLFMAFFTGFHVAVIGYDLLGWQGIWHLLVNPVAWLEFPASWISLGMGIRISVSLVANKSIAAAGITFNALVPLYFKYVFSLLLIAAILETALIRWAEKHKDDLQ